MIGKFTGDPNDILGSIVDDQLLGEFARVFADNCPLWTYVLAETVEVDTTIVTTQGETTVKTRRLGPVGGRIVAETFVGIMRGDSSSFLAQDPLWQPSLALTGSSGCGSSFIVPWRDDLPPVVFRA